MDRNFFVLIWLAKGSRNSSETVECYLMLISFPGLPLAVGREGRFLNIFVKSWNQAYWYMYIEEVLLTYISCNYRCDQMPPSPLDHSTLPKHFAMYTGPGPLGPAWTTRFWSTCSCTISTHYNSVLESYVTPLNSRSWTKRPWFWTARPWTIPS